MGSLATLDELSGEVRDVVRAVSAIVRATLRDPAFRVVLFGSWATGQAWPRSDIDIGIDGPEPVDTRALSEIRDSVDRLRTLYTVDLVDLRLASAEVRRHALETAFERPFAWG